MVVKNDNFDEAEQVGRSLFQNWCNETEGCTINKWSKNKYSSWDVSYTINGLKYIGEIKVREQYTSDCFFDWWLEKTKYDKLLEIKKQTPVKSLNLSYINFHPLDNEIRIYDINNMDKGKTSWANIPFTTKGNNTTNVWTEIYNCNVHNESYLTLSPRISKLFPQTFTK
jgi:hypothetical protein